MKVLFKLSVFPNDEVELNYLGSEFENKSWDELTGDQQNEVIDYVRESHFVTVEKI